MAGIMQFLGYNPCQLAAQRVFELLHTPSDLSCQVGCKRALDRRRHLSGRKRLFVNEQAVLNLSVKNQRMKHSRNTQLRGGRMWCNHL